MRSCDLHGGTKRKDRNRRNQDNLSSRSNAVSVLNVTAIHLAVVKSRSGPKC